MEYDNYYCFGRKQSHNQKSEIMLPTKERLFWRWASLSPAHVWNITGCLARNVPTDLVPDQINLPNESSWNKWKCVRIVFVKENKIYSRWQNCLLLNCTESPLWFHCSLRFSTTFTLKIGCIIIIIALTNRSAFDCNTSFDSSSCGLVPLTYSSWQLGQYFFHCLAIPQCEKLDHMFLFKTKPTVYCRPVYSNHGKSISAFAQSLSCFWSGINSIAEIQKEVSISTISWCLEDFSE